MCLKASLKELKSCGIEQIFFCLDIGRTKSDRKTAHHAVRNQQTNFTIPQDSLPANEMNKHTSR
jgi:dihydroorotase